MTTIFLDESGYTGADLFNVDQPVFVLSSHNVPEEECARLKAWHFPDLMAKELKFSALSKRARSQEQILNLLAAILQQSGEVKLAITHKRYALTAKMVDVLVETVTHKTGFDLYDRGANIALSNLAHLVIPSVGGEQYFDEMMQRFQVMMRTRSRETYDAFFAHLHSPTGPAPLLQVLENFKFFDLYFDWDDLPEMDFLDVSVSSGILLLDAWRKETLGHAEIVADESKRLLRERHFWDDLNDRAIPRAVIGHDRRTIEIPIVFDAIRLDRSENYVGLQIADLIAGAVNRIAGKAARGQDYSTDFDQKLNVLCQQFSQFCIWPSIKMSPESLGTTGPNFEPAADVLGQIFRTDA